MDLLGHILMWLAFQSPQAKLSHKTQQCMHNAWFFISIIRLSRLTGNDANGLKRFPEAHVVAQDPVEAVTIEERQPVHTFSLVAAQVSFDRNIDGIIFDVFNVHQFFNELSID